MVWVNDFDKFLEFYCENLGLEEWGWYDVEVGCFIFVFLFVFGNEDV